MACAKCIERGKTWEGDDPVCAFEHSAAAAFNNWRCATLDALWDIAYNADDIQYGEDCTAALIPLYGADGRFIVLSCYKRRGKTDCAKVITDCGDVVNLTLQMAEHALAADKPSDLVSYAAHIPCSTDNAEWWLNRVKCEKLERMSHPDFMRTWCAVVYLHPGLHPDDCGEWPEDIRLVALEAFRRRNLGEITDDEMYPSAVIAARLRKG